MLKRGQVTVFAIVGVLLVIIIMLLYFLNDQGVVPLFGQQDLLSSKLEPVQEEIESCVNQGVEEGMVLLGKQGGQFNPVNFIKYKNYNVPYYCTYISNSDGCLNVMPFLKTIENSFEKFLHNYVGGCIDPSVFEGGLGYEIKKGEMDTKVLFNDDVVEVAVDLDVLVKKGDATMNLPVVKVIVPDVPFEELYSVAIDAVNVKANGDYFDQMVYMLDKKGAYIINVDKPYPDIIYKVNKKDSSFELWFAIEGREEYII